MIRTSVLFLLMASLAGGAWAQTTTADPQLERRPPTHLSPIALDVVVTDKRGHAVTGLQASDFTVLDNGQPTAIQSFRAAAVGESARTDGPTQVILLLDEVNASYIQASQARGQVEKFFSQSNGQLPYPLTVVILTDTGMRQLNQPSRDAVRLAAMLKQEKESLRVLRRSGGFYSGAERMQVSLRGVRTIASSLIDMPGRKLLVWIGPGWWLFDSPNVILSDHGRRQLFYAAVDFSTALREARVVLYAVDPLGMDDFGSPHNFEWQDFLTPVRSPANAEPGDIALQTLASESGGKVLFGDNDVAGLIAQCVEDGSTGYELSVNPEPAEAAVTWHTLTVKVDKPGLRVRTRNGYYAER